ncbi:MAG: NmrA family NAD(P)-binding protein [Antarcticimicrobium sp.]|uniref:NmrA family NAD(P)-binding protein n=1 Tax=Antarcticimicrobium sp. TaxID=2824147 RepID=UPI002602436B|nr:NmrA family NAD(P)-binding protein [Antarcticimicrobium sp.]MDF1716486.1 NmrA family NAD(P)-binding protein [Antarcticimicrobium sp.]
MPSWRIQTAPNSSSAKTPSGPRRAGPHPSSQSPAHRTSSPRCWNGGVDVRAGDFNDPATLGTAFEGGGRLLIISTDDLEPGKRLAAHGNALSAAREAGVSHIVYTSLTNPDENSPIEFAADHRETEALITETGIPHTILRNCLYADLLLMNGQQALGAGALYAAAGDGKAGYVTRADCARAAAALLDESGSTVRDVTGPETVAQTEIAATLSEIAGKEIPYVPISRDALMSATVGNGLPEFMADVFSSFDVAIAEGYLDVTTSDVEASTGQKPQSVRDFLLANTAAVTGQG